MRAKRVFGSFVTLILLLQIATLTAAEQKTYDSVTFVHHGITFTLSPLGITAVYEDEALTLQFSTDVKALNNATIVQTEQGYTIDYGTIQVKVTVPPNQPKVKMTFVGNDPDATKFKVTIIGKDVKTKQQKTLTQDGDKVKLSKIKFDWSDASKHKPKYSSGTLTFDTMGAFEIDPTIGVDQGSYTLPKVIYYNDFGSNGQTVSYGGYHTGGTWTGTINSIDLGYSYYIQTGYWDSPTGTVTTDGVWKAQARAAGEGTSYSSYATASSEKVYNITGIQTLQFYYEVHADYYDSGGTQGYATVAVYDMSGNCVWSQTYNSYYTETSGTYSGTVTLSNINLWKITLYATENAGSTQGYAWALIDNIIMINGTDTVYYYANSTGAYYNATTSNTLGNAYLFVPKGTTISSVLTNYSYNQFPTALQGWSYRKAHTITGSTAGAVTDYQVRITVWNTTGTDSGENVYLGSNVRQDFGDVRFTDANGNLLSYWIESINSQNAVFWVKVPSIPASPSTATIYIYYGNPSATTTSNGTATFVFFDDFSGSSLDSTKWTLNRWTGSGSYSATVANGYVEIYSEAATVAGIVAKTGVSFPFAVEGRYKFVAGSENWHAITQTSSGSDSDWVRVGYITTSFYYQKRTSGTISIYQSFSRTAPTSWARISIFWTSSSTQYFENGAQVNTVTTQDRFTSGTNYLQLFTWDGGKSDYDWIAIRNYVNPEPTHGSWGSEKTAVSYAQSTNFASLSFNSTHNIIRTPNLTNCTAVVSALIVWSAPNAVYDLQVSPTLMIPSTTISAKALLKDPYGNPLNTQATIYLLNAQGQTVNQTSVTTTNGWLNVTFTAPATNGYYYIQAVSNDPNYKGVLYTQIQVSDGFYITEISEYPSVYYKQPNTLLSITVQLKYLADNTPVPNATVKLLQGSTILFATSSDSQGYATVRAYTPENDFTWVIYANTSQSENSITLNYEVNSITTNIALGGDRQNLEVHYNTTVFKGLLTKHYIAFYATEDGDGSVRVWINAESNNVKIPNVLIQDSSLMEGDDLIATLTIENYNPNMIYNAEFRIYVKTVFNHDVMTLTFAAGTIKPAETKVVQCTTKLTGVAPFGNPPLIFSYSFTSDFVNFTGQGGIFPILVTADHVRVKSAAISDALWDSEGVFLWTLDNSSTRVYAVTMDALSLTHITSVDVEIPQIRECTLTARAEPYTVESGRNFTIYADALFNSPPSKVFMTLEGEGISKTVESTTAQWVLTAPQKPLYALNSVPYTITVKDPAGLIYAQTTVTVDVFNFPPKIYLNNPKEGSILNGTTTIDLQIEDDSGVTDAQYRIDDGQWQNLTEPYDFELDTAKLLDGRHILYVRAVDGAGFVQTAQFYFYSQNGQLLWQWQSALQQILGMAANISFPVFIGFGVVMIVLGYVLAKIKAKKPQPPIVVQIENTGKNKKEGGTKK